MEMNRPNCRSVNFILRNSFGGRSLFVGTGGEHRDSVLECGSPCRFRARSKAVRSTALQDAPATAPSRLAKHCLLWASLLFSFVSVHSQSPVNEWVLSPANIDVTTVKDLAGDEEGLLHGRMATIQKPPALYFDGTDTYIELAGKEEPKSLPKSKLTAEAWVAVNSPAEWGGIVGCLQDNGSFEKGWVLGYNNDKFNFALSTSGDLTYLNASVPYETGRWYHVVGTFDGSRMRLYVNGVERGSSSQRRGTIDYSPATFVIGSYLDDNEFFPLEGFISGVRIYNRALTGQQVRNRYNSTKSSHATRPKPPTVASNRDLSAGPYLTFTARDRAVVRWETAQPMSTRLAYGTSPTLGNRINLGNKTQKHEATIDGITPGATYHYSVGVEREGAVQWLAPATGESDFNYARRDISTIASPFAEDERMRKSRAAAEAILAATGIRKGYAIDYGCGEGRLTFALAKRTELTVIGVTADTAEAARARAALRQAGIYGTRVTIHHRPLAKLGHTEHLFNLAVSSELLHEGTLPGDRAELLRVLRPSGGVLALGGLPQGRLAKLIAGSPLEATTATEPSGDLLLARRKSLDGAGEWTHTYGTAAQTSNSSDEIVNGGRMALQWFGKPGARGMIDRQGRNPPPLTSNGFLYVQGDNRIWGQDAFNGTILWNYEFPSELRRVNTPRDGSNMCADDSSLFVAMRDRAYRFDGRTGGLLRSFPVIAGGVANWGYIANDGDLLFGSSIKPGSEYTKFKGTPYWYDSTGTQDTAKICSDNLFAIDKRTGGKKWEYRGGKIINSSIAIGGGRVCFVESNSSKIQNEPTSRIASSSLWSSLRLVALNQKNGAKVWSKSITINNSLYPVVFFLTQAGDRLILSYTTTRYYVDAYSTRDGRKVWSKNHSWNRDHHGGHMYHPLIIGDAVLVEPFGYRLSNGSVVHRGLPQRGGCSTMSASKDTVHYINWDYDKGSMYFWDVATNRRRLMVGSRSSCWLSLISGNGMILSPTASSGCRCRYPIQTSIGFTRR